MRRPGDGNNYETVGGKKKTLAFSSALKASYTETGKEKKQILLMKVEWWYE